MTDRTQQITLAALQVLELLRLKAQVRGLPSQNDIDQAETLFLEAISKPPEPKEIKAHE